MDETMNLLIDDVPEGSVPEKILEGIPAAEDAPLSRGVENRCYTPEDLMIILNAGRNTVYSLIKENLFRSFRLGKYGKIRISKKSFDDWLEKQL